MHLYPRRLVYTPPSSLTTLPADDPSRRGPAASSGRRAVTADSVCAEEPSRAGTAYRRRRSGSQPAALTAAAGVPADKGSPAKPAGAAASSKLAVGSKMTKTMRFRHVRFNKMYARLTWEGPPINITDWGIVLDPSVYHNIDGVRRQSLRVGVSQLQWTDIAEKRAPPPSPI